MSCGRAYKDRLQNEKVLFLCTWMVIRLLKNLFSLNIHSAHFCKIKTQFENIILSICRATEYRVLYYIKLKM